MPVQSLPQKAKTVPYLDELGTCRYRPATPEEMEDYRRRLTAPGAYVIRLRGHSLEPEFRDRDLLLVDPHQDPEHGDFVHVRVNGQKMTKQFLNVCGRIWLRNTNPEYMNSPTRFEVLGVVTSMVGRNLRLV